MTMKIRLLSVLLILLVTNPLVSYSQFFKRPSKKVLLRQVDSLLKRTDSLEQALLGFQIPVNDSILLENEINEGGFEANGDEFYYGDDSLSTEQKLSIYYHQNALNRMGLDVTLEALDSVQYTSGIPDSVYIQRLSDMNSFIKLPYNSIVKNHIIHYTQKMPEKISTILGLAQYYMPIFEEVFDAYDMPLELKAMAVIESALNPRAVSRARAKGMWQFMYRTALSYKLTINSYVDERLDPIVSAHAAARYLMDSYRIYGDWILAIASYNCGTGNVNKAIRRAGGSREFWDIYPFLPRETRGYVPAFVAALYTMRYYPEHQIKPAPIEMPAHVDTFEVNKMLHFEQITALLDISIDQIRDLNPQYIKDVIPGQERTYVLRLPFECSGEFAAREQEIYSFKDSVYFNPLIIKTMETASDTQITHRVRNGETLSNIAGKYGVRIADIKYWNGLRSDRIVINQRLIIHTNRETAPRASDVRTASASSGSSSSSTQENLVRHKVRPGETLGGIAEKYSVSAANIRLWNNLRGNTIYAGKTLKIYSKGVSVTSTDDRYEYYTVRSGDNLWGISKKLGVSVDDIRALNGFGSSPKIFPGQKIKVKKI